MTLKMPRTNEEWLADLANDAAGAATQAEALTDLREYLMRAVLVYLERHHEDLIDLAWSELEQMAEDFSQEALLQIQARLDTFRGESRFTTWAYRFVINVAASELRLSRWRTLSVETRPEEYEAPFVTFIGGQEPPDPETAAARNQVIELIGHIVDEELTDRQRFALVNVHFRGAPMEEVARQLESTPNNVYKLLYDARKKIRDGLRRRHYSESDVLAVFGER